VRCDSASNFIFVNGELRSCLDDKLFNRISGESIYEVIKMLNGVPLFFEDHMDRLSRSLNLRGNNIRISNRRVKNEINGLIEKTGCYDINVKLLWYPVDDHMEFMTYFIQQDTPTKEAYQRGVHTILFSGERKNPHVKAIKTSYRDQAANIRESTGAFEALLVDDGGYIPEGTRSNFFYLIDNQIYTPPSEGVLLGVTRQHVMSICSNIGIMVKQQKLHLDGLTLLEGAFITGTSIDVLPVRSIEDVKFDSALHPTIDKIARAFDRHVQNYVKHHRYQRSSQ
jgi:branched-chain amino acid aminotransferase